MKKIFTILDSQNKKNFIILIFFMIIASLLEMLGIGVIVPVLMSLTGKNFFETYKGLEFINIYLDYPNKDDLLLIAIFFLGGIYFLKNLYMIFFYWIQSRLIANVIEKTSQNLLKSYLSQPYTFYINNSLAIFNTRFRSDLSSFRSAVVAFSLIFTEVIILFGIVLFLVLFNSSIFFIIFLFIFLISILFYIFFKNKFKDLGEEKQIEETKRSKSIQEIFGAIKEIKITGLEKNFLDRYKYLSTKLMHNFANIAFLDSLPKIFFEILAILILVLILSLSLIYLNSSAAILPTLGVFIGAAFRLFPSINRISSSFNKIKYSAKSVDLILNDLELSKAKNEYVEILNFKNLEFKNVFFNYSNKKILNKFNFFINGGDKIFIFGKTGSGKSTLLELILGLKKVTDGKILFDQQDFTKKNFLLKNIVGYVPQSVFLFDDTIENNISLFNSINDPAKMQEALRISNLEGFVNDQQLKIKTRVGHNGAKVSGGQKQRIGIARAIYKQPEIIVFDEATNALDEQTEIEIIEKILKVFKDKTFIMVSHNKKLAKYFNKSFHLENGILNEER